MNDSKETSKIVGANLYVVNMFKTKNKENISKAVKFIELNQKYFNIPQSKLDDILTEHNISKTDLESVIPPDLSQF